MRLEILETGYPLATRALFAFVRLVSGYPLPDAARLVAYRPDFYGNRMKALTHEAMRGPSDWSVADRELMAAWIAKSNECAFCIGAHSATASRACGDGARVAAVLDDPESAPIEPSLRATLRLLGKLAHEGTVTVEDVRALLDAGVSRGRIEDALAIFVAFDATNRLADAFGFAVPSPEAFDTGARFLLRRGYR